MADARQYTDSVGHFNKQEYDAHWAERSAGHIPFGNLIKAKEARFTVEQLRQRFFYCPTTGSIRKKMNGWLGEPMRAMKDGYIQTRFDGCNFPAHRLAYLLATGVWPTGVVDHVNHDRSDNRIANLRDVSPLENRRNRSKHGESRYRT